MGIKNYSQKKNDMTPNYLSQFKTKQEAFTHILACLVQNHGCAGDDGLLTISLWDRAIILKPLKKRKEEI